MKRAFTFNVIILFLFAGFSAYGQSSVLATGDWYKFRVKKTGLHKITYNDLKDAGVPVNSIDPRRLQLYGNGGGMLPQPNSDFRYYDLEQNDIMVVGESDGSFDNGDYILFWGEGVDETYYDNGSTQFRHSKHLYEKNNYYYVTVGTVNGQRVPTQVQAAGPLQTITTHDEHFYHEEDQRTIIKSGREFFGEKFDNQLTQTFSHNNVDNIDPASTVYITVKVVARSCANSQFTVQLNGNALGTISLSAGTCGLYGDIGTDNLATFSLPAASLGGANDLDLTLTYNKLGNLDAYGILDYYDITVTRDLNFTGNQTFFRSVSSTAQPVSEFIVADMAAGDIIWDVTNPEHPKSQAYNLVGSDGHFIINTDSLKSFVVFNGSNFTKPTFKGKVSNQDLHGITTPPEFLIVTHKSLVSAANKLANFRMTNDGMNTLVVTTEQIYDEFSSGKVDVTAIRDFAKMLYDRSSGSDSLRYLLLFGEGSYDYGDVFDNNIMLVPVYESRESLNNLRSYASDDYIGFLEDSEGLWSESPPVNHTLDIGVGRIPAKNNAEANDVVNKIIHYSSTSAFGKWRNSVLFVADDGDSNIHMDDADDLAVKVDTAFDQYVVHKVYLDAYQQIPQPDGEIAPTATDAVKKTIDEGVFILNYSGHGSQIRLSGENMINMDLISKWTNLDKLPVFVTATCSFGWHDNPEFVSGAEIALLNPKGGCIALLTTTRVVFASTNFIINNAFYDYAFDDSDSIRPRLGDIIRVTKNASVSGVNNRNFSLLGDPSLKLNFPEKDIVVTKFKGNNVTAPDTLKALDKVTLEGEIRHNSGAVASNFNGTLHIVVYDKATDKSTLGYAGPIMNYEERESVIFDGEASVVNGIFSVTFVVPKDISFQYDNAKISLYASNDNKTLDAGSGTLNFLVGGTADSIGIDNTPPVIELFMDDESFVFGGTTGKNTVLLANLSDENGINTTGYGVGHEITGTLNEETEKIILNEFYTAAKDNYQEGKVEYDFEGLSPGLHGIKVKAWDTYNNSSEEYLEFVVAENAELALAHVLNYPNPFSTYTTFHFDHNRSGDDLEVMVEIYSISGRLIKTLINRDFGGTSHFSAISWDGRDEFGDKIGKGVYVYKVSVRSISDGSTADKYQKLVILN